MLDWIAAHPSALAAAASLAVLWLAETLYPVFAHGNGRHAHGARNVTLGVINGVVRALFFPAALVLVSAASARSSGGVLHAADPPAWAAACLAVMALDAAGYAWHVASHHAPLLWRFHAVHHHDNAVDSTTAFRFHFGDVVAGSLVTLAVVGLVGLRVEHVLLYEVLLVPVSIFHHGNVRLPRGADRALGWLIVTPRMHWVHHSSRVAETNSNYAPLLSIWDRVFGTYTPPREPGAVRFGLDGFTESDRATLLGCLVTPMRPAAGGEPIGPRCDGPDPGAAVAPIGIVPRGNS